MSQKSPSSLSPESASARLKTLRTELKSATLMAVSKYSEVSDVETYYHLGQLDFGENRVSELSDKANSFKARGLSDIRWHFIGNLQRNKIKKLLETPNLVAIHSIARTEILDEIIKSAYRFEGEHLDLYLEVNLGGEDEKHGFRSVSEVREVISKYRTHLPHHISLRGLMGMAPIRTDNQAQDARACFKAIAHMAQELNAEFQMNLELSMGMSADYLIALECGSSIVRIGSYLFK